MEIQAAKPEKIIFVIMPFTETPTRNKEQLTSFFDDIIKKPIESEEFRNKYKVRRSDETFNITEQIIKDLFAADIVIADLSGRQPNPNVMYELGVRLAFSHKPVILMRENHAENRNVFDITGFYAHPYDPFRYVELSRHLIEKIRRFETGEEVYESPVLKAIGGNATLQHSSLRELSSERQWELVLQGIQIVANYSSIAFGPHGNRVSFLLRDREISTRSGFDIANNTYDEDLLKALGIQRISLLANEVKSSSGDGVKTAIIIAGAMMSYVHQTTKDRKNQQQIAAGIRKAMDIAIKDLSTRSEKLVTHQHLLWAAITAAKDREVGTRVVEALDNVKDKDLIFVSEHSNSISKLEILDDHVFDFGYVSQSFLTDTETDSCILENCHILVYLHKISSLRDVLPILEHAAKKQVSILIVAEDIEGEALTTMQINNERGSVKCCAIKIHGLRMSIGSPRYEILKDFASLTNSTLIGFDVGRSLNDLQERDFGYAEKVIINSGNTKIIGGAGSKTDIDLRIKRVRQELSAGLSEDYLPYYKSRLASLVGKAAFIKIGSISTVVSSEERYKILSALSAISTLEDEGWVAGGGKTLFDLGESLNRMSSIGTNEETIGIKALITGLQQPYRRLMQYNQVTALELPDGVIDSVKILRKTLEIVREHVCSILETEKWDVTPRARSGWANDEF